MILTFLLTDYKIAEIEVDLETKKTKVLYTEDNEQALNAVLNKNDMTYIGLERRLKFLMDDTRPLSELIESIRLYDINTPIQYNLSIKVKS